MENRCLCLLYVKKRIEYWRAGSEKLFQAKEYRHHHIFEGVHKWHDPSAAEFLDEKAFYHSANKKA